MKAPVFWQHRNAPLAILLTPLGWVYASATEWRLAHGQPWQAPVPVVCVGNLTAGGAGKTPIVRDLAARLKARGCRPGILSRGYGGREDGPIKVDPALHDARQVGDEPLLLGSETPCWVAIDRAAGARAMVQAGIDVIVMDDGLQNPSLAQNLRLIVVDGAEGFGNERPIPAGPLRERVITGTARADALVVTGKDACGIAEKYNNINVLQSDSQILDSEWLRGAKLVAFAGIGRPEKFKMSLTEAGAEILEFHPFADHHSYSAKEIVHLQLRAESAGARLVTTEKDWVRLNSGQREQVRAIAIRVSWSDEAAIERLIDGLLRHG